MSEIQGTLSSTALGWLAKTASLAAVYYAMGKLALLLAIPPGYATAVWPAAGVALAGILLFGYRVWPGVFVGSFLVTAPASFDPASLATILESVALPAGIAAGAVLQAVLGAFLVRRFVGFPSNFDRLGRILGTMVLGGPVACLTSATIGVASLLLAGSIEAAGLVRSWGTWWFGESIGVLVVIPLASAWGTELHRVSRRTRLFVSLPILVAVAMTVFGYLDARARELRSAQAEFERRAEIMARALEQTVLGHLDIIQSIVSLFETSGEIDRAEFRIFVKQAFARHRDLHGLSWNALVSRERRAAVEEEVRRGEYTEFRITERDAEGKMVRARDRDGYVVVFYIEPYEGNEQALGFDLTSDPVRARALAEARDTGQTIATPPIILVQESEQKPGFLFFAPIYRKGLPHDTLDRRRRNLHSFVSGVFRAEGMVEEALKAFQGEGIDYGIVDTSDPEDPRMLYGDPIWSDETIAFQAGLAWSTDLEIAGRRWTVRFRPSSGYTPGAQWGKVWGILTGGSFFSSLLGAFLLVVAGRASATERSNEELRREIDERRRAEAALSASEGRFRAVFENAAVGVAIVDTDERVRISNEAVQRMLGYSGEELAGMIFAELTYPEDVDAHVARFRELVAGSRPYIEMDKRYKTRRGEPVWGHLTASLVRDPDGKPLFAVVMVQDITERKIAEETLRKSQIQLVEAQRIARFASWEWDLRSDVASLSDEAYRIFGVDPEDHEASWNGFLERVHPDDSDRIRQSVEDALAGKKPYNVEFRLVRPDGAVRTCHSEGEVQRDVDGSPTGMRGSFHDITERKEHEQALLYTQFSVDHAVDGIFRVEQDASFSYVNDAACEMTGYPRETLLAMTVFDVDPNYSREMWPEFWQGIRGADNLVIESLIRRSDGTVFPAEIAINYLEVDGVGNCFASARDSTERKKAEEERMELEGKVQQAQKLESLGVLAGGIAHDFNNLLVGVLGNADLALAKLAPAAPAREYVRDIETSARRAADLANQLLAYSGKGKFVVEPIDLSDLVDEISHLVEVSVSKKVAINYDLARNLPSIEADATQVRQVVLNLITNASEAIGESSGVVSVTTGQVECDTDTSAGPLTAEELPEGTCVFVEVADTGSGMDEETRKRIFDPFFTTKLTGRGLGLAAVLGIVRGHKGAIEVHSEPERGATIKVLFPASERSALRRRGREAGEATWKGEGTVLLVDDEEMVRQVASSLLTLMGFAVLTAADGVEALQIYRERTDDIALVLLDLAMPRMGGEETFTEIRRVKEDVKVILSSGYNEQDTTRNFAGKGLAGFIQKPYRLDALRDMIRAVLDK